MFTRTGMLLLAGGIGLAFLGSGYRGDAQGRTKAPQDERKSKEPASRLSQPAMAVQLALEGQRRRSPTLMLAAVELLAPLKESAKSLKGVQGELKGDKSDAKPLSISVADWIDQAREFAKEDKEMTALLDKRLEQLGSRGLIYSQGKDLKSVTLKGMTFKVVWTGALNPGQEYVVKNAIFEANRPADVFVVADLGAKIDLLVQDTSNNRVVGQRVGDACAVCYDPKVETTMRIGVLNAGNAQTKVVVLVSW